MKNFQLIVLLCLTCFTKSYGQTFGLIEVEITKERNPKRIYTKVEIIRLFPGGDSSWIQSLEKRLDQSISFRNGAKKGKYTVSVKFIVDKNGRLSEVMCDKDPGFGMCKEVIYAIKNPLGKRKWVPAQKTSEVNKVPVTNQ